MILWAFSVLSVFLVIHPPAIAMSGELVLIAVSFWSFFRPLLLCNFLANSFRDSIYEESKFKSTMS